MKQTFINKEDWLYAACLGLHASQKIARLVPNITRPADLFELGANELADFGFNAKQIMQLQHPDWARISDELRWLEQDNHHLLTLDDPAYPDILRAIRNPPLLLFVQGKVSLLAEVQLAMVGSRRPSCGAQEMAYDFARSVAGAGIPVTSGLALGIDAQAHMGALAAGGATIAVVATGLDQVYPARHQKLAHEIVSKGGAIVSEHCLNTSPNGKYFPQRNRIISGLSQAVLVVEAAQRSGSLVTARHAMEQGREVMAIPGSLHNPMASGTNSLIKQGAKLVTSVTDLLQEFTVAFDVQASRQARDNEKYLTKEDKKLLKNIGYEVTAVDDIVARSNLPAPIIASRLMELSLRGQVQAMPGGYTQVTGGRK